MPDRSRLAKNTAFQYLLQIAKYLFPFVTVAYLTRVLGPDIYAVRAYVIAAMALMLVFLEYGFTSYGTKSIAQAQNVEEERLETSAITYLRLGLAVVGGIVLIPITLAIPIMAAWPLYVTFAYIGTCFKAFLPDYVFRGQEDMGIITYRYVLTQVIGVGLIVLLVHGPEDLLLVAIIEAAANLVGLIWSWENVIRKRDIGFVQVSKALAKRIFGESTVFFVSTAATTMFSSFTTIMVGLFIQDAAQVSYWAIAMTAVVAVQSLYAPVTNSLYPHMVKRRDFAILKRLLVIGMPIVIVGSVAFAYLSDWVMLILGGEEFMPGAYVIAMVAPVLVFSFPAVMLGFPVLAAVGRVKQLTTTSVVAAVFHVTMLCVLAAMGQFTIEHVAILRCATEAVLFIMRAIFVLQYRRDLRAGCAA